MRLLLKVLGSLVVLVIVVGAVMYVMGSRLPREHVASAAITIDAPQGKVWALIEDVSAQPQWRTGLKAVEPMPDENGHRCWREVQSGMRMPLCEEVVAAPTTRVVAIADPNLSFGGTWTYNLTALTPTSSSLTITENGTTGPALWRFLGHYVMHEDSMIRQYERDIQKEAEKK